MQETALGIYNLFSNVRMHWQVMYQYMQQNAIWTLSAIGRKGDYIVIPPRSLLHTMFHIGNRQFDQVQYLLFSGLFFSNIFVHLILTSLFLCST